MRGRVMQGQFRRAVRLAVTCLVLLSIGCGESADSEFEEPAEVLTQLYAKRKRHDPENFVEVELGIYAVTVPPTDDRGPLFVRFTLFGVVPEDEVSDFGDLLVKRSHRMRDGIMNTIRRSETQHIKDPSLNWVKSELVPNINRNLRCQSLRDVVFTSFSLERG